MELSPLRPAAHHGKAGRAAASHRQEAGTISRIAPPFVPLDQQRDLSPGHIADGFSRRVVLFVGIVQYKLRRLFVFGEHFQQAGRVLLCMPEDLCHYFVFPGHLLQLVQYLPALPPFRPARRRKAPRGDAAVREIPFPSLASATLSSELRILCKKNTAANSSTAIAPARYPFPARFFALCRSAAFLFCAMKFTPFICSSSIFHAQTSKSPQNCI